MSRRRKNLDLPKNKSRNKARVRHTFMDHIRDASHRAELVANRPANARSLRHIQAALAEDRLYQSDDLPILNRMFRWFIALLLLPVCFVTSYTFTGQFSNATLNKGFWFSREFWFFATGALMMCGWFFTGLLRRQFLYLYVLGHELTHAIFVFLHLGWVSDMKVSSEGGYIATNKSNLLISLSPYFFPFWSMVLLLVYSIAARLTEMPHYTEQVLFALTGATWTFHMLWTLWMIPRDQPDLRDNDTFFSLVVIYLANIILLSAMLCMSAKSLTWHGFCASWCINAENFLRLAQGYVSHRS